jgi:diadenosine tetraphosphatase ApaH/serine/threonine PP2A family protein phosphatase
MRVAIATDIHGNRYGGDPDASVELARRHCSVCLAGNHDLAVVDVLSLEEFSRGAALAAQWTREVITPETRDFLLSLKPEGSAQGVGLYHASPRDPVWEYVLSGLTAELCFDVTDYRVSLIGHSHVALSFDRQEGSPASGTTRKEGTELDLAAGQWLVNPGSTGQPRDGDPRAAWLMLDTDRWAASYMRAEYDIAGAQEAIRAANLPDSLAERLAHGQ